MKRLVSVSVAFYSIIPISSYINKYHEFSIRCTIVKKDIGILKDKYLLKLEGTEDDIQMFIDYLKYEGFKIK